MESPFENNDIIKKIIYSFKDDCHNLLKLAHISGFFREEIIENDIYPHMIDIIKGNNIYQLKKFEEDIKNIKKNKDSKITLLKNNKSNLNEMEKVEKDDPKAIQFTKDQINKYKENITQINEKRNYLNLRIQSLRKKNLFFNQYFIELIFHPLPRPNYARYLHNGMYIRHPGHQTAIWVDKIKLKYIVENDNREYKYIENLYYHKKSNILHLTNCGSLKNSDLNKCVFNKKDDLIVHDYLKYCKKCTQDIRNFLI